MTHLTVTILGKEFQIACQAGSETALQSAANYLDQKMLMIRNNGKVINFEGVLITVAINLAYELLQQSTEAATLMANLTLLEKKLNTALQQQNSSLSPCLAPT